MSFYTGDDVKGLFPEMPNMADGRLSLSDLEDSRGRPTENDVHNAVNILLTADTPTEWARERARETVEAAHESLLVDVLISHIASCHKFNSDRSLPDEPWIPEQVRWVADHAARARRRVPAGAQKWLVSGDVADDIVDALAKNDGRPLKLTDLDGPLADKAFSLDHVSGGFTPDKFIVNLPGDLTEAFEDTR